MKTRIMIVDDDKVNRDLLALIIERAGFATITAGSGKEALDMLEERMPDLMILDIMMEEVGGFEVLTTLRTRGIDMPIMLLSAKSEDADKVEGFGLGADDYVTKPYSPVELTARLHALLRRARKAIPDAPAVMRCGAFRLEPEAQTLYKQDAAIALSTTETALLAELMKQPNKVYTKAQLFGAVWQHSQYDDNALNVYINRIRNKLEDNPKKPAVVQTVWGIGYRFVIEGDGDEAEG